MRQHLRAFAVGSGVAVLSLMMMVSPSLAQSRVRGQVTDEYDNPIPGVAIVAEGSGVASAATDDNGRFQFLGLSGEYTFTATAPGYVGIRTTASIRQLGDNRPINFELRVAASGQRFRSETTFVSDPPGITISFGEDGTFELEDAEGEGEGTYTIQDTNGELVVRKYDGPDDKFSLAEPVTIQFADEQLTSFMMGDQKLVKE